MKKLMSILILGLLLILTACLPGKIDHPVRNKPTELETQALINNLRNSTVALLGHHMEFQVGLGSGMIFMKEDSPNGSYYYYVVTNNHVVRTMTHVVVRTWYDRDELGDIYASPGEVTIDEEDIAVVRFESDFDYPVVDIIPFTAEEDTFVQLSIGQTVFGIGTPINPVNHNLVSNFGIIADLSSNFVGHTANINPGNSGGPLFAYDGTFVGINTQRIEYVAGQTIYLLSESIDVNQTAKMIKQRLAEVTPRLGIYIDEYSVFIGTNYEEKYGDRAEGFDPFDYVPANASGVVVIDINSTRPSFGVFQRYDLIIAVNGITVTSIAALGDVITPVTANTTYYFTVTRYNWDLQIFETLDLEVHVP